MAPAALRRVRRELGRREREDQPAAAGVDRVEVEHVAQERPDRLRVLAEQDGVDARDHGTAGSPSIDTRLYSSW